MPTRKLQKSKETSSSRSNSNPHSSSRSNSNSHSNSPSSSPDLSRPHSMTAALMRIKGLESEMASVIREMQEKVKQLEYLNNFSRIMNSSLDTKVVREKALEATCQLVRCESASLLLVDSAKSELYWETMVGEVGHELKQGVRLPINDQSIAGYVAMTGESLVVNDVEGHSRGSQPSQRSKKSQKAQSSQRSKNRVQYAVRTMICVPLMTKGGTIGVLLAINKVSSTVKRASQHQWADFYENDKNILETLSHQVAIAIENSQLYTQIKNNFFDTVEALSEAIEKKDHYTGGHTKRVVYYAMCIAKYMNLTADEIEKVRLAAILHDVGKIGIEDKILKKDSQLDEAEWKVMQKHPELGFDIMKRVEGLKDVIGGMRYHHERWDGKGYPLGLKGEEIPLLARIVAVADAYDAMVSTRPYRKGMDPQVAYDEIVRHQGTQFDPGVVQAFLEAFENEKMGKGSGGSIYTQTNALKVSNRN